MKRMIRAAEDNRVRLQVEYYPYERYTSTGRKTAKVSGATLLEALSKMVDHMMFYFESEDIEDRGWTAEDVLEHIADSNGDGCDYIVLLKNLTTDDIYIESDYEEEEEDWDDDWED